MAAAGGTVAALAALLVLGIPAAVIPNSLFIRMTPTEPFSVVVWLPYAPLMGLLLATYVSKGGVGAAEPHA